jgi:hypothetical protein
MKNKILLMAVAGGALGYLIRKAGTRRSKTKQYDKQFASGFPRYSGAISAVTGGPPEDMNAMPATPSAEGPIWDGSQVDDQGRSDKVHSRFPA